MPGVSPSHMITSVCVCVQVKLKCSVVDDGIVTSSCVSFVQRLISERDTLRETNDELRCAQVQQRCLSGAGEFAVRGSHSGLE